MSIPRHSLTHIPAALLDLSPLISKLRGDATGLEVLSSEAGGSLSREAGLAALHGSPFTHVAGAAFKHKWKPLPLEPTRRLRPRRLGPSLCKVTREQFPSLTPQGLQEAALSSNFWNYEKGLYEKGLQRILRRK